MGEFVVARSDATELLEPTEESLNEVASLVLLSVELAWRESVAPRRNDGLCARLGNDINESVTVISLVGNDGFTRDGVNQCGTLGNVGYLAFGENQAQGIAQRIHAGVNLGGQSATRAANRLIATVFFGAPAECWCARTTVESMNRSSKSASPQSASATRPLLTAVIIRRNLASTN